MCAPVGAQGACVNCPSSTATLKHSVKRLLMHYIPEVTEVVAEEPDAPQEEESDNHIDFEAALAELRRIGMEQSERADDVKRL